MMINFWLAARFGRVWLRVRKGQVAANGHLPDECMLVARGEPITASRLLRAATAVAGGLVILVMSQMGCLRNPVVPAPVPSPALRTGGGGPAVGDQCPWTPAADRLLGDAGRVGSDSRPAALRRRSGDRRPVAALPR